LNKIEWFNSLVLAEQTF